jgi:hypothetical protein
MSVYSRFHHKPRICVVALESCAALLDDQKYGGVGGIAQDARGVTSGIRRLRSSVDSWRHVSRKGRQCYLDHQSVDVAMAKCEKALAEVELRAASASAGLMAAKHWCQGIDLSRVSCRSGRRYETGHRCCCRVRAVV